MNRIAAVRGAPKSIRRQRPRVCFARTRPVGLPASGHTRLKPSRKTNDNARNARPHEPGFSVSDWMKNWGTSRFAKLYARVASDRGQIVITQFLEASVCYSGNETVRPLRWFCRQNGCSVKTHKRQFARKVAIGYHCPSLSNLSARRVNKWKKKRN
jgi:hypothetical protein